MASADEKALALIAQVWELADPVIRSEGGELIEVEYRREPQGWVLRLYIDREQGVTVEDCAKMSLVVGDLLDVADLISNPYHLEVSSPGLNRPLRKVEHFQKALGKTIELRTASPLDNRRNFKGELVAVSPEQVKIDCEGRIFEIPLILLERARLCYFESLEK